MVIDGIAISRRILSRLAKRPCPRRSLAAVLVGDDPSSQNFVAQKARVARMLGIPFMYEKLSAAASEAEVVRRVRSLSRRARVEGVIIQLPLPARMSREHVLSALHPAQDVDCLTAPRFGAFAGGDADALFPPVAGALKEILETLPEKRGMRAAIIGAGSLVGRPVAAWFARSASVAEWTVFGQSTALLRTCLSAYDLVVSGVGRPGLFQASDVRNGARVVDFGYARRRGALAGDFTPPAARDEKRGRRIWYTPTPGGTGPVVVAKLFENFYRLAQE